MTLIWLLIWGIHASRWFFLSQTWTSLVKGFVSIEVPRPLSSYLIYSLDLSRTASITFGAHLLQLTPLLPTWILQFSVMTFQCLASSHSSWRHFNVFTLYYIKCFYAHFNVLTLYSAFLTCFWLQFLQVLHPASNLLDFLVWYFLQMYVLNKYIYLTNIY